MDRNCHRGERVLGRLFVEATSNLEDVPHRFIRAFTVYDGCSAVSNVLTQLDCRNTGKKLNERIVASPTGETCGCHDAG